MNREELLTKMAMELHPNDFDYNEHYHWHEFQFTGDEYLQRRAELINKPSWDDAPEWAQWLAQDEDGEWSWFADLPEIHSDQWGPETPAGEYELAQKGCMPAGHNWRDTLEKRPQRNTKKCRHCDIVFQRPDEAPIPHDRCTRCHEEIEAMGWDEQRADTIGQNGNDGAHYVSDGSTAKYYELPVGALELQDLISYRNMNAQDGEIFRAIYRKGLASHSDALRDAKKVLFYAQAEVERLERYGQ